MKQKLKKLWLGILKRMMKFWKKYKKHILFVTIFIICYAAIRIIPPALIPLIKTNIEIRALEQEKQQYIESIRRDSIHIEMLKNDDFLEQYAREKYFMQGKDEQIFIVE